MATTENILVAGGTGYLGGYILKALEGSDHQVKAIARHVGKLKNTQAEVITAELTKPQTLKGCCKGVDVVISSVGITRQKDGLTYMDVDYQANSNLLQEALESGVKKFIYVSVLHGDQLTDLKICAAKERFVNELKASGMDYCIIRPTGFFSDMGDFLDMAKGGRVFLFGDGKLKMNPIHGADLAEVCLAAIVRPEKEIPVGGPDTMTQNEIAALALQTLGKPVKITHLPDGVRKLALWVLRTFTSPKFYGPFELFMTAMAYDMSAPEHGKYTLVTYYRGLVGKIQNVQ